MAVSFTVDLEDPTDHYDPNGRYVAMTRHILAICTAIKRRATFFIIGHLAEAAPQLIKDIAARGHEIAYHTHAHLPLTQEDPLRFKRESRTDKDKIEQLIGKAVNGFRAPQFSLTPKSLWVIDILGELGFRYSSSIMPTKIARHGYPGAPQVPFKWPNGLIELPLPITPMGIPYLGGIYLYAMPSFLTQRWIKKADKRQVLWTYTHPYDFDRKEKFTPMAHTPLWMSHVLFQARRMAEKKNPESSGAGRSAAARRAHSAPQVSRYLFVIG